MELVVFFSKSEKMISQFEKFWVGPVKGYKYSTESGLEWFEHINRVGWLRRRIDRDKLEGSVDVGTNVELEKGTLSAILEQSEIKKTLQGWAKFSIWLFNQILFSDWLMESQIENLTPSEIVKNHENRVSKVETVFSHRPGITVRR